jgi:hypothetical protein
VAHDRIGLIDAARANSSVKGEELLDAAIDRALLLREAVELIPGARPAA